MGTRRAIFAVFVAALTACGCTYNKKDDGDGRASSLVYSPAARLPPDRGDAASPSTTATGDLSEVAVQQDDVRPPAGRRCRVHLRRDGLGVANAAPYPLSGNAIATERAQITGTLERVGRDWLVLRGEKSTYWVPRETVLAVEFVD